MPCLPSFPLWSRGYTPPTPYLLNRLRERVGNKGQWGVAIMGNMGIISTRPDGLSLSPLSTTPTLITHGPAPAGWVSVNGWEAGRAEKEKDILEKEKNNLESSQSFTTRGSLSGTAHSRNAATFSNAVTFHLASSSSSSASSGDQRRNSSTSWESAEFFL